MRTGIRAATTDDAAAVAAFFTSVYEVHHGLGTASVAEMLDRTLSVLFPAEGEPPTVFVSELADVIQGVAATRVAGERGECELVTVQVYDTVQGRGIAQTLLREVVAHCTGLGATTLTTEVPLHDVRARGFLRREGFAATADDLEASSGEVDGVLKYSMSFEDAATS